jgi:ADP-ribose pyrophosphatase YjhB (NUDIX family)
VKNNGSVLLLRSSEFMDQSSQRSAGYFSLPRFTLDFGANPEQIIEKELREQFNQQVESMSVIAVQEKMRDRFNQTVELAYEVTVKRNDADMVGRYTFLDPRDLERYAFPKEIELIRRLLN